MWHEEAATTKAKTASKCLVEINLRYYYYVRRHGFHFSSLLVLLFA